MSRRLVVISRCPLCGKQVEQVPDHILRSKPHQHNVEFVVTRAGHKQYFHSSCWYDMIAEKRPYTRKVLS